MSEELELREEINELKQLILTKQDQEDLKELKELILAFFKEGLLLHEVSKKIVKHIIKFMPDYELKKKRVIHFYKIRKYSVRKVSKETQTTTRFVKKVLRKEGLYGERENEN